MELDLFGSLCSFYLIRGIMFKVYFIDRSHKKVEIFNSALYKYDDYINFKKSILRKKHLPYIEK